MEYKDYYKTLGVSKSASQEEIKRAYKSMARKYHPDVSKEPNAEEKFKEVGEAYEVLKDHKKKEAYDRLGSRWKQGQEFHPPPDWDGAFEYSGSKFSPGSGFSDFFEELFGRAGRSGVRHERFIAKGADQHARIAITLDEAFSGTTLPITLEMPEVDKNGRLISKTRRLDVKIPEGVTRGQIIRLEGQGGPGYGGGKKGDLFLEITFKPHPLFKVVKRDIYLDLPITPWEAALGHKISVTTLKGNVQMKIPSGARSGQKLRLKGLGLSSSQASGDQYVILHIVTPDADTPEKKAFYEKMSRELPLNPRKEL